MKTELTKLRLPLDPSAWHGSSSETIWVEHLGSGRYSVKNSPFYFFGLSLDDTVFGAQGSDGVLVYAGVADRSGHSTYRLMLSRPDEPKFHELWAMLAEAGCTYEEGDGGLLSVDVPASSDLRGVYALFEAGQAAGVWDFEEAHVGHLI